MPSKNSKEKITNTDKKNKNQYLIVDGEKYEVDTSNFIAVDKSEILSESNSMKSLLHDIQNDYNPSDMGSFEIYVRLKVRIQTEVTFVDAGY